MSDYVFPQKIADFMSSISQRTQYEAGMLSLVFILFGLIFFAVVLLGFSNISTAMKIGVVVNTGAGLVLLGSHLVTTYQQYKSYKEVMGLYSKLNIQEVQNGKKEETQI